MKRLVYCVLVLAFTVCSSPAWANDGKTSKAKADVVIPGTTAKASWASLAEAGKTIKLQPVVITPVVVETPAGTSTGPVPVKGDSKLAAAASKVAGNPSLSIGQRMELGLSYRNIRGVVKDLHDEGELDGLTESELSVIVLTRLAAKNPEAYARAAAQGSMEDIIAFISRLLPLILQILALFGV